MRFSDGYVYWTEGEKFQITRNFSNTEFECPWSFVSTREQQISVELVAGLQWVRDRLGCPLIITSGYRSPEYQENLYLRLGRTPIKTSQHTMGNAADITVRDDHDRPKLQSLVDTYFLARGYANSFIHVDTRTDKERTWTY